MTLTVPQPVRPARRARPASAMTQTYTALAQASRTLGLQRRARWFYALVFSALVVALGGVMTGVILLDGSWWQLLMAGALGVIFTQLAFLGHEASHRQVLTAGPANDRVGWWLAVVGVGISYSWWMDKHTRHHANPNKLGKDPDLAVDTVSFVEEDAATCRGLLAWVTRHQGVFFFPLLLGEGVNLHVRSTQSLWTNRHRPGRKVELAVLAARFAVYAVVVFWLMPPGVAFAFLGVQLAVFGFYMGVSFAPNHIGMTVVGRDVTLDFFSKQVLTSRNVSGGWWATVLMGGLNYQTEHHLFPSMARPHLAAARRLVREHCRTHDVAYTETNLLAAWAIVVRHLNKVGLAAPDAFRCRMVTGLR